MFRHSVLITLTFAAFAFAQDVPRAYNDVPSARAPQPIAATVGVHRYRAVEMNAALFDEAASNTFRIDGSTILWTGNVIDNTCQGLATEVSNTNNVLSLNNALKEMMRTVKAGNAEGYANLYAEDAVIVMHGSGLLKGRRAIAEHERTLLREFPALHSPFTRFGRVDRER